MVRNSSVNLQNIEDYKAISFFSSLQIDNAVGLYGLQCIAVILKKNSIITVCTPKEADTCQMAPECVPLRTADESPGPVVKRNL